MTDFYYYDDIHSYSIEAVKGEVIARAWLNMDVFGSHVGSVKLVRLYAYDKDSVPVLQEAEVTYDGKRVAHVGGWHRSDFRLRHALPISMTRDLGASTLTNDFVFCLFDASK